MEPMVRALKPLANFSEWLWDFHINGEGRDLTFSIHKEPWTDRNITNAQYAQDLTDNFTRWQAFFDEEGGFFKCGNFEQNGGSHDMSRALGNARNSVTLGLLGDSVRMSTGANALQLMGHNDNGWDQGQIMVLANMSVLSPFGISNALLKATWQPSVLNFSTSPPSFTNASEVFVIATRNASAMNLRVVNLNTSTLTLRFTWASEAGCADVAGEASVLTMSSPSLTAVNTPAEPQRVSIVQAPPLPITGSAVQFAAPRYSISVISVPLTGEGCAE